MTEWMLVRCPVRRSGQLEDFGWLTLDVAAVQSRDSLPKPSKIVVACHCLDCQRMIDGAAHSDSLRPNASKPKSGPSVMVPQGTWDHLAEWTKVSD